MSSSLDHIGEEIAADVTHHDAAFHRILTKLRIFDEGGGYVSQGFRTCPQWLSWRVNWTLGTARERVRVAKALGRLPLIDRALECGRLSYCKVRALTRVANAANEATLVEMASHMTGDQLERLCRKFAAVKNHDDPTGTSTPTTPEDDIDRRYVRRRDREDGMVVLEAVLHPDEADVVFAAIERIAKERCRARTVAENALIGADDAADAAADIGTDDAAADIDAGAMGTSAETPASVTSAFETTAPARDRDEIAQRAAESPATTAASAETPTPSRSRTRRLPQPTLAFDRATALVEMAHHVLRGTSPDRAPLDLVIAIPIDTLASPHSTASREADACGCDLPQVGSTWNGSFVSPAAARRLACDAGVMALIEDVNGNALSVGRKTRTIPASMKRAMMCRDQKCRFPGCNVRVFLQGHHLEHWADGGKTEISNLILLCGYHHRFVHEYGFTLEFDPETNTVSAFDPARRRVIPAVAPPGQPSDLGWTSIERRNASYSITADTQPTWDATPVDWGEIVDILLRSEVRTADDGN